MKKLVLLSCILAQSTLFAAEKAKEDKAAVEKPAPTKGIQAIIDAHYQQYAELEHFSAIQVTVLNDGKMTHFVQGKRSLDKEAKAITTDDLFDIGSITKSFTGVLAVKAASAGKLNLDAPLSDYLKQYPHWGDLKLKQLLNMSAGLPNYSNAPKINYLWSQNLKQFWNPVELIDLVYPKAFNPPLKSSFFYSNTGYVLMDMILSNSYEKPYRNLLADEILKPLALSNTYYPIPNYPTDVLKRMVRGYAYNIYDNPELLGQDVTENNLSWAGAAGGLVANSADVVRWVRHLFVSDKLLTSDEKQTMQSLVSQQTGQAIDGITKADPKGFGLGIIEAYHPDMGKYWYYEGQTLGYRAFYIYKPCNQLIFSVLFNSATNGENDHGGLLMMRIYQEILKNHPSLVCKKPQEKSERRKHRKS